jgi:hypothetical protein
MVLDYVLVAHAYNPSNSGGRDQEDPGSLKPVRANSLQDPISKTPITKKELIEWLKVDPEFNPQHH